MVSPKTSEILELLTSTSRTVNTRISPEERMLAPTDSEYLEVGKGWARSNSDRTDGGPGGRLHLDSRLALWAWKSPPLAECCLSRRKADCL